MSDSPVFSTAPRLESGATVSSAHHAFAPALNRVVQRLPPLSNGGMDHASTEVAAAVAQLERQSKKGAQLALLARNRYLAQPPMTVREQLRLLQLAEDADRTYRNWVHRLHQQVLLILTVRSATTRGHERRSGTVETNYTRASMSKRTRVC